MARPHSTRPGIFQADALYGGKRRRKDFDTLKAAEKWEADVKYADERGLPMPGTSERRPMADTALRKFAETHKAFLWGDTAWSKIVGYYLPEIFEIIGPETPITEITYERLVELVGALSGKRNANSTINRKLAVVSKLLKHAKRLNLIEAVPDIPRKKESAGRIRFFTKVEEKAILERFEQLGLIAPMHITTALLYTGARWGEFAAVEKRDIDYKNKRITFWRTKADEPRTIPITPQTQAALEGLEREFPQSHLIHEIPYDTFLGYWLRMKTDLGYEDDQHFVIHTLRHTCASRLVQAGVDLRRVQTWMGHKTISTTLRYAHLAPTDLEIAAAALVA